MSLNRELSINLGYNLLIGFYICLLFVGLAQDELTVGVKILESIFLS